MQGNVVKMADNRLCVVGRLTDVVDCRRYQVVACVSDTKHTNSRFKELEWYNNNPAPPVSKENELSNHRLHTLHTLSSSPALTPTMPPLNSISPTARPLAHPPE
jgi:hypothetical protein